MFAKFFCLVVDFLTSEGKFLENDDNEWQHIKNGSHIFKYLCSDKLFHFGILVLWIFTCYLCVSIVDFLVMDR